MTLVAKRPKTNWSSFVGFDDPQPTKADISHALQDERYRTEQGGYPLRRQAARVLGLLRNPQAIPALRESLSCSDIRFREAAIQSLECNTENALLQIKDQGIGIPLSTQNKIFEPFIRGENVRNIPGTGLGLVVVKKCVELHGGGITPMK